jgi:DNA mismatch repair protein MLH3
VGNHKHGGCCSLSLGNQDDKASLSLQSRISKTDLKRSEVISQVDQKFILVKVPVFRARSEGAAGEPGSNGTGGAPQGNLSTALVLIDQHAADERCRVEALMTAYFEDVGGGDGSDEIWRARVEHLDSALWLELSPQDCAILERYRIHFE